VLRVKGAEVESVAFVSSPEFFPGDPDYAWVQQTVEKALTPEPPPPEDQDAGGQPRPDQPGDGGPTGSGVTGEPDDSGAPVSVDESCTYDPVG
jgi:hypothetical protein